MVVSLNIVLYQKMQKCALFVNKKLKLFVFQINLKFPLTTLFVQVCESLGQKNIIQEVFLTKKKQKKKKKKKNMNHGSPLFPTFISNYN